MAELKILGSTFQIPAPQEWTPITREEEERNERASVLKEKVWLKIPRHLSKFQCHPAYSELVNDYDPERSYALIGPTGSGKSTACVNLVAKLLRLGRDNGGNDYNFARGIFWVRADAVTNAGGSDDESAERLLHRAEFCRLLILDDFSAPSKTLLRILQQRYDAQRPVVATNGALDSKRFEESIGGEAVMRWLLQCGGIKNGRILVGQKLTPALSSVKAVKQ